MAILFFWIGLYSLLTQVLLIRELAIIFHGHEISFGVTLTAWLIWAGAGSISQNSSPNPKKNLLISISLLSLFTPISDLLIRFSKLLTPTGNIPGLFVTIILPFILLALPAWFFGSVFGSGASFVRLNNKNLKVSHLYFFESLGALLGGILSTMFFLWNVPSLVYISAGGLILILLSWIPFRSIFTLLFLLPAIAMTLLSQKIDSWSRQIQWEPQKIVSQKETPYGHIALIQLENSKIIYENGTISAQFPDPEKEEELITWTLLSHKNPEKISAIGIFPIIALKEILKHPVQSVEIINSDPSLFDFIKPSLNNEQKKLLDDKRVRFQTADPRVWIKNHPHSYDIILQTLPEPENASLNRFYTQEFFEQADHALKEGGILAFSIASSQNYLLPEIIYTNASIIQSIEKSFKYVEQIPGTQMTILASNNKIPLDPKILEERYRTRKIKNRSLIPESFPYLLHPERMNYFKIRVQEVKRLILNRDLYPITLFLKWRVWLSKFVSPFHILGLVSVILIFFGLVTKLWRMRQVWLENPESLLLMTAGFSGMTLEIVLLYIFQSVSGALYWQMGILIASFMTGLSIGSGIASFYSLKNNLGILTGTTVVLSIFCFILAKNIDFFLTVHSPLIVFGILLAVTGFLVGALFPLTVNPQEEKAQVFYAADLWGSALGAFSAGTFLAPLIGYVKTLYLSSILLVAIIPAYIILKKLQPKS